MNDRNLSENSITAKASKVEVAIMVIIAIIGFSLLAIVPRYKYPLNIIPITAIIILLVIQFIFVAKAVSKKELIDKNNTLLEWIEPREAWHITERHCFSPKMLALWFIVCFLAFLIIFGIVIKFAPPMNPNEDTLTFAKLPVFSAGLSIFIVALYASTWWWAKIKVTLTTTGIMRVFHNQPTTWKYDRIKSYHFEPLCSKSDFYTFFVLQNHRGKTWKIAFDDTIDKAMIEEILNKHKIPKIVNND